MTKAINWTIGIILGALLIWAVVSWEKFKYHECKKVGHSTTYCIMMINSK